MLHAGHIRFPLACTLRPNDSEHAVQKIWLQKQGSAGERGAVPAGKELPAGCHDCSLSKLHSTFQCIATERKIHRSGSSQGRGHKESYVLYGYCTAATKTSQSMKFFRAPGGGEGGRAEIDSELVI